MTARAPGLLGWILTLERPDASPERPSDSTLHERGAMNRRTHGGLRTRRSSVALGLVALMAAACSSGSPATTGGPTSELSSAATQAAGTPGDSTPVATTAATPSSTGPAAFLLTMSGDANVSGTWGTSYGINCNNPTFDGLDILFFAQSPDGKAVVLITLRQGSIGVSERAGAGAAYTDREFQGTGVTSFDAARGASFDSDLTPVPGTGQKPGTLGTITHVAGSIDCGNQRPGTSTLVPSGTTAQGPVGGSFVSFRVACNSSSQYGNSVNVSAIVDVGSTPTLLIINLPANRKATIFSTTQGPAINHSYAMAATGALTISSTGAHVDADFAEVLSAGAAGPAHTIHLAGDVVCGTNTTS